MVLFGHPGGNPNSHQAALAHFEAGRLAAFCVPWMPSASTLNFLEIIPPLRNKAKRLARRRFPPLEQAPKVQGRFGELRRLFLRSKGRGNEGLSYEANDWLMRTMRRECRRPEVTAIHSYEDCSLWQFEEAKHLGKACIYDMPIGYYPWWQERQAQLARDFSDWLPAGGLPSNQWVRPEQKSREMELADLVLVPSTFVKKTIHQFYPDKKIALAPYGVDLDFWRPPTSDLRLPISDRPLRFIYAGQCSIRKGTPALLNAWRAANLKNAELELVGLWQLATEKLKQLPPNVRYIGPMSPEGLRERFQLADIFVFPSFFEGFGLVILEAMACGLPVIATDATAGPDILDQTTGKIIASGDDKGLVNALCWFESNPAKIFEMSTAARYRAETSSWREYRKCLGHLSIS